MGKNETIICTTYEEFDAFLKEHQHGSTVAYDVETNARNTFSKEHTVIGFSLAFDGDYGCYVPLKALDFQVTPDDKRLIEKRTRNILSTNTVVVYNCSHEYPATRHWLGLELPAVDDVYTMVKLMMGNADKYVGNGGLKMQSVMHLHYDNWSEDLDIYFKTIKDYKKNPLAETALLPLIDAYYEKEEYPYIRSLIEAIPDSEYTLDTMSYEYVPYKLIGKYGSLDSTVLLELREFYINWMLEESKKLGVNLFDGYKYWMQHSYSGYILERNGAYWNDKKAQEVEDWCEKGCKESLEALIRSPLSYPWIMESLRPQFNTWLMKEQGASLLSAHYDVKSMTKSTITVTPNTEEDAQYLKNMSLLPIVKKPTKKNPEGVVTNQYKMGIENFLAYVSRYRDELGFNLESLFRVFCKEYTDEYFSKEHSVDEMKKLLNPTSTSSEFYRFVSKVLIYDDIIIAKIYHTVQEILNAPNFDIDYYKTFYNANKDNVCEIETEHKKVWKFPDYKAKHPEIVYIDNPSSDFLQMIQKLSTLDDAKMIVSLLKKYITNHPDFLYNYRLSSDLFNAVNYRFETLDESNILELYSYYEFVGITIEDKSTWNEHFEWLYNYRWYKKYSKLVSTYIKGTVGRKSVWYVFKEDYESGEDSTERLFPYYSPEGEELRKHPEKLKKYDTVLQTRFGTNTADSGRWKATMHCLHPDTKIRLTDGRDISVKDLYTEFQNGKDNYVYSRSETDKKLIIELIRDVYISHQTTEMLRVYLDNGEYFEVTPDHKMVMRDGSYREAQHLKVGDSLYPISIRIDETNHEKIFDPDLNKEIYCHYLSDEFNEKYGLLRDMSNDHMGLNGSWVRHHIDFNPLNNDPTNVNRYGWNTHDEIHKCSEGRKKTWERIKYRMSIDEEYKKKQLDRMSRNGLATYEQNFSAHRQDKEALRQQMNKKNYDPEYQKKCRRGRILKVLHDRELYKISESDYDAVLSTIKPTGSQPNYKKSTLLKYFSSYEEAMTLAKEYNHNVVKLEWVHYETPIDVYSVAIKSTSPSFSLSCGVMSKNTMPSGKTIKGIITSRYKGGVIAMPDCSQAEVRVLARVAEDENLIKAFRDGLDVHRFVASLVFQKTMEEVTPRERKVAKSAVFGILYGETVKSFADEHFNGDIEKAEEVFDYFYTAFPNIKKYVEMAHNQYDKFGKVLLALTGRYIDMSKIAQSDDPDRIYRQSQNFIIQGCLLGNTLVKTLDGKSKPIEDLTSLDGVYVYAFDRTRNKVVPALGINPHKTRDVSETYKITFDNDKSIEVTEEHPIMLRDGNYKKASELTIGDSIMPMYWHYSTEGEIPAIGEGYELIDQINGDKDATYRLVTEEFNIPVGDGQVRHHKDLNKLNNTPTNLEILYRDEHLSKHQKIVQDVFKRVRNNEPITEHEQTLYNKFVDGLNRGRETEIREGILSKCMAEKNRNRKTLYPEWYENQRLAVSTNENNPFKTASTEQRKKWLRDRYDSETEEQAEIRRSALKQGHSTEDARDNHRNASYLREQSPEYNFNRIKKQLGLMYQCGLNWKNPDVWDDVTTRDKLAELGLSTRAYRKSTIIDKIGYELFLSLGTEFVSTYNHKVKSIEIIHHTNPVPVYDISVPNYENFVVDLGDNSGIVVHNCTVDLAGLILYQLCRYIKNNALQSKPFCFIHDSIESDLHPDETFRVLDALKPIFNEYPDTDFGVPMASDIVFSCNMGAEIEVEDMIHDSDYNDVTITLKGFENDISEVIDTWNSVYDVVEEDVTYDGGEPKEVYVPLRGLFQQKVVISPEMGTTKREVSKRFHVIRKVTA